MNLLKAIRSFFFPKKITVEDFDLATTVPWSPKTCLIAQFQLRTEGTSTPESRGMLTSRHPIAMILMNQFDVAYGQSVYKGGNIDWHALDKLRASLPITIDL